MPVRIDDLPQAAAFNGLFGWKRHGMWWMNFHFTSPYFIAKAKLHASAAWMLVLEEELHISKPWNHIAAPNKSRVYIFGEDNHYYAVNFNKIKKIY